MIIFLHIRAIVKGRRKRMKRKTESEPSRKGAFKRDFFRFGCTTMLCIAFEVL